MDYDSESLAALDSAISASRAILCRCCEPAVVDSEACCVQESMYLTQVGAELSFIRSFRVPCRWADSLSYCCMYRSGPDKAHRLSDDEALVHDVMLKMLQRGPRPFTSIDTERKMVEVYGASFGIRPADGENSGSISYHYDPHLEEAYLEFSDLVDPWDGELSEVELDPEHPENERKLMRQLVERYGSRIIHCAAPQVPLEKVLAPGDAASHRGQRGDLLLSFPNGTSLLLEPGDHDEEQQVRLDARRDRAFSEIGTTTVRPRNEDLSSHRLYSQIHRHLTEADALRFLGPEGADPSRRLAENYLFLLPSLIARVEWLLIWYFFREGLIRQPRVKLGFLERDLECAELAVSNFLEKLERLITLYDIDLGIPAIDVHVQRNPKYQYGDLAGIGHPCEIDERLDPDQYDLVLDVSIKCNGLTPPVRGGRAPVGAVRSSYRHNSPVTFAYRSQPRPISIDSDEDARERLDGFVRDLFRKHSLRPGQPAILRNVLAQQATIGLLPTSAGKSLCYQLAALLTPGTTLVVDPIVALMHDQVESLKWYGVERVFAWHAGAGVRDGDIGQILGSNLLTFISPERLQRPGFRQAMGEFDAKEIYVNYAVIDEAHCVSMWGHDYRPAYLTLADNFKRHCTFQGHRPVVVALTGTASQLVLIDLKRELGVQNLDAIVRPKSFDREELNFRLLRCSSDKKREALRDSMGLIARRLNAFDLFEERRGIVFAYTPAELWQLFGEYVGDAESSVRTVLNAPDDSELRYGMYSGSPPRSAGFTAKEWDQYKRRTLAAFKRGAIRVLFGNTAVSVGIDNEELTYVINYAMPQSMEAYYQQCGRAGRKGQASECCLIFTDDAPDETRKWLNREIHTVSRRRRDDIGLINHFHRQSFPGQAADHEGAMRVFRRIFSDRNQGSGMVGIPKYLETRMALQEAERTERYISYWLVLGVLNDYTVTGMGRNEEYQVVVNDVVRRFLKTGDAHELEEHVITRLHEYLERYRPISRGRVIQKVRETNYQRFSEQCLGFLIAFIYEQIEYQRRESIRTMVEFCNQEDTSPERLRARIKAYFDTSEKFSAGLMEMSETQPDIDLVSSLVGRLEGFDDAEHLFWETRRLLDERFRPDWAAANLYAMLYRQHGEATQRFREEFGDMVAALEREYTGEGSGVREFLAGFFSVLRKLDAALGEPVSRPILAGCFATLFRQRGIDDVSIVDDLGLDVDTRDYLNIKIMNLQLGEIVNGGYARALG